MLCDTDVLIWFLRGNPKAARQLAQPGPTMISAVTSMELIQGARDKRELALITNLLGSHGIQVLPLTERIGHRAQILLEHHALKDGIGLADALIAATALEHGVPLCTGNLKHFRTVTGLTVVGFKP